MDIPQNSYTDRNFWDYRLARVMEDYQFVFTVFSNYVFKILES
jgi:hypothetical protein